MTKRQRKPSLTAAANVMRQWLDCGAPQVTNRLVVAGLFLLAELVAAQRGDAADRLEPSSRVAQPALLGLMMLLAAASAAAGVAARPLRRRPPGPR